MSRYALAAVIHENTGHVFPFGTFFVNAIGCLIIGLLSTMHEGRLLADENMKMLLAVGFCGAFTTFSTFIMESAHLAKSGETLHAFLNITLSVVIGFAAFILGARLGAAL